MMLRGVMSGPRVSRSLDDARAVLCTHIFAVCIARMSHGVYRGAGVGGVRGVRSARGVYGGVQMQCVAHLLTMHMGRILKSTRSADIRSQFTRGAVASACPLPRAV